MNGEGIVFTSLIDPAVGSSNTADASKEACCNSCAANPLCLASTFYGGFSAGSQCYVFVVGSGTCSAAGQYSLTAYHSNQYGPDQGYFVSNGNCGVYNAGATQ